VTATPEAEHLLDCPYQGRDALELVPGTRRCRHCGTLAADVVSGRASRLCSKVPGSEGLVSSHSYVTPRPNYDPRVDYPERYHGNNPWRPI
jgi:hypothetical protein